MSTRQDRAGSAYAPRLFLHQWVVDRFEVARQVGAEPAGVAGADEAAEVNRVHAPRCQGGQVGLLDEPVEVAGASLVPLAPPSTTVAGPDLSLRQRPVAPAPVRSRRRYTPRSGGTYVRTRRPSTSGPRARAVLGREDHAEHPLPGEPLISDDGPPHEPFEQRPGVHQLLPGGRSGSATSARTAAGSRSSAYWRPGGPPAASGDHAVRSGAWLARRGAGRAGQAGLSDSPPR